jgi:hypothetical protein
MNAKQTDVERTMTLEFYFRPSRYPGRPLLEGLEETSLSMTLLRGRLTERDAWLKLQVTGTNRAIEAFIRKNENGRLCVAA